MKGWQGESHRHVMASKGIKTTDNINFISSFAGKDDDERHHIAMMKSLKQDTQKETEEERYSRIRKDAIRYINKIDDETIDDIIKANEQLAQAKRHLREIIKNLYDIEDLSNIKDDMYGKTFDEAILFENENGIYNLFRYYYNIKHPFKKGDKVWDDSYKTWIYITNRDTESVYSGYYFNEEGKRKEGQFGAFNLERGE